MKRQGNTEKIRVSTLRLGLFVGMQYVHTVGLEFLGTIVSVCPASRVMTC